MQGERISGALKWAHKKRIAFTAGAALSIAAVACGGSDKSNDGIAISRADVSPTAVATLKVEPTMAPTAVPTEAPKPTPTEAPKPKTPEEQLTAFAQSVLKPEFAKLVPTNYDLKLVDNSNGRKAYQQELPMGEGLKLQFGISKDQTDKLLSFAVLVIADKQPKGELPDVISLYPKYMNIPATTPDQWKPVSLGTGIAGFETVVKDVTPLYKETRSAYVVTYKDTSRGVTIAVGAAQVFPGAPGFEAGSVLK